MSHSDEQVQVQGVDEDGVLHEFAVDRTKVQHVLDGVPPEYAIGRNHAPASAPDERLNDPEQALQIEMFCRIQRAAEELYDAVYDMRLVAVTTPQEGDAKQWRWQWANACNAAKRRLRQAIGE